MGGSSLFEGKFLKVTSKYGWEYVERSNTTGVIGILAITEDDELLLVEQFRIPVDNRTIEIPAGLVGDNLEGQSPEEAVKTELEEETGYQAKSLTKIMKTPTSSGLTSEKITLFKAEGLTKCTNPRQDPAEDIVLHKVHLEILDEWLKTKAEQGYLVDSKIYTCLYFL